MIQNIDRLRVTMEQMQRVIRALDDLKLSVLQQNPQLFATMSQAPLDDLNRLRAELADYVRELSGPAA